MTIEPSTAPTGASAADAAAQPPIAPNIPTVNALGERLSAAERFQMASRNKAWVANALTVGTPEYLERERFVAAISAEEDAQAAADSAAEVQSSATLTPPHEFQLPYDSRPTTRAELEDDATARSWLSASGFDKSAGSQIASIAVQLERSREWTPTAVEQHERESVAKLRAMWGAEFAQNVALLDRLIVDVDREHPGLEDFLSSHPYVLRDPRVAHLALDAAKRRYAGR